MVGSDRCLSSDLFTLEKGLITSAIAGEVVKGLIAQAMSQASGFQDKIEVLINGLAAFEPSDATTITICGMEDVLLVG